MGMEVARISEIAGFAGFILWALIERGFTFLDQKQSEGHSRDRASYWQITISWYGGAALFSLLDASSLRWTTFEVPLKGFQGAGILFVLSGLIIRLLARKDLGKQYSVHVETSDAHKLVKNGVYRALRHPAYLGLMCLFIGIPVCEGSWGGMVISIMGGIPAILNRIRIEEESLSEWFGEEYEDYKAGTWRLIPYVW
jgi:protein-S-isoprenylcysteine O-methyltransferase Ste14